MLRMVPSLASQERNPRRSRPRGLELFPLPVGEEDFADALVVGAGDDVLLLHPLDEAGGAGVAHFPPPPGVGGGGPWLPPPAGGRPFVELSAPLALSPPRPPGTD